MLSDFRVFVVEQIEQLFGETWPHWIEIPKGFVEASLLVRHEEMRKPSIPEGSKYLQKNILLIEVPNLFL